ncbi:D(2) dopamine receptor-like [Belonocnema kinseyi]|uniref:D(2) dopamine receptor-like n=1 Tax=Belonocnema kinseyi TaxID=2817044 RepID=UPI00143CDF9A|nr:D(2) dopamine receptor-like [Belonocnema kinseyi]XP_033208962.1 D(2) dopamine receptor-like [Belonocnema kinseyi]XP_033208964.1 D(2) dopamine receptor-like [Belonocnema kinseyi]
MQRKNRLQQLSKHSKKQSRNVMMTMMIMMSNAIINEAYDVTNSEFFFYNTDISFFDNTGIMNFGVNNTVSYLSALEILNGSIYKASSDVPPQNANEIETFDNWWAMLASVLVLGTAAGNILVCLAITWERRLQNVTNYFLMSLAITDLMVAILVMPLGILTLVRGYFPLPAIYCLAWICLDVLFCTASIMHLCTISVDRYLSLRYPMKFGRNKTRRRVILKILFVWLLSIAMSLPLCLMYSKDDDSVLVKGTCQIPDPLYKLIGSIICFFIPLGVMLITYALTVKLLADQSENIGGGSERSKRRTWKKLLVNKSSEGSTGTPVHTSAASTDTELTTLDTHDLWLPESEPKPAAMSALHEFGAELLKWSKGLEGIANIGDESLLNTPKSTKSQYQPNFQRSFANRSERDPEYSLSDSRASLSVTTNENLLPAPCKYRRRASTYNEAYLQRVNMNPGSSILRKRSFSFHEHTTVNKSASEKLSTTTNQLEAKPLMKFERIESPSSSCDISSFVEMSKNEPSQNPNEMEVSFSDSTKSLTQNLDNSSNQPDQLEDKSHKTSSAVVTWKSGRRGSSAGTTKTSVASSRSVPLRRAATMRAHNYATNLASKSSTWTPYTAVINKSSGLLRVSHSRNSSVISRNSSRHGRIIRLEQKATKVLGVVFFTFVILWSPFFVLNLTAVICADCEENIDHKLFDFVTWLGYSSSMVNPIFYTIFNKVFRQAFKKVILCQY